MLESFLRGAALTAGVELWLGHDVGNTRRIDGERTPVLYSGPPSRHHGDMDVSSVVEQVQQVSAVRATFPYSDCLSSPLNRSATDQMKAAWILDRLGGGRHAGHVGTQNPADGRQWAGPNADGAFIGRFDEDSSSNLAPT